MIWVWIYVSVYPSRGVCGGVGGIIIDMIGVLVEISISSSFLFNDKKSFQTRIFGSMVEPISNHTKLIFLFVQSLRPSHTLR